jgi:peptidyl-prolyl cis-trans isomerase B (cyclophilin B)
MKTSLGDIKLELFEEETPLTVKNFLEYVDSGHYNNTIFHRVINDFMIQGGGFDTEFEEKFTEPPIKNEAHLNTSGNERGTIAMARTSVVDSATAQFFINVKDNSFLNHQNKSPQGYGYCVFGKVSDGMDVVDKIKQVETDSRGYHDDVPVEDVVIYKITRD